MEKDTFKTSRRRFLRMVGGFTAGMAVTSTSLAKSLPVSLPKARSISLYNLHTGESLDTTFCIGSQFLPDSLNAVNHLLRDHRTDEVCDISPQLLVLLDELRKKLGTNQPFQVISGYRSPATNAMLREHSSGVARKSLHMQGKAIDIRMEGVNSGRIFKVAKGLQGGGAGLYSGSDFVHVDVGPVRFWGA